MVLGSHGESLVARVQRRALRERPRRRARRRPRAAGRSAPRSPSASGTRSADGCASPCPSPSSWPCRSAPWSWRSRACARIRSATLALGHQTAPSSSAIESASAPRRPSRSEIASGSEQSPKASSPPSEMIEIRRAWRSAGSANELNCSTACPRISGRCLGPGDVRDRERELARAGGQPGHAAIERAEAAQGVEEGVERVGVVVELPLARLRVDHAQPGGRVGFGDRQVEVHEGVAVAELPRILLAARAGRPGTGPGGRRRSRPTCGASGEGLRRPRRGRRR